MITLRVRDVIIKFLGDRRPDIVHDAKRRVAFAHILDNDPQGADIMNLGERHAFFRILFQML